MNNLPEKEPEILCFKDIKLKKLKWLWPNRFPLGKPSLVVGDPNIGKSFFTLYMAAQVSTGRPWAAGEPNPNPPSSVVILTLEDDLADTVGVRLKAAGADMNKIYTINAIKTPDSRRGLYNLVKDMDMLIKTVQKIPDVKLVIIDPLPGYMEGKNENKNAEVREFLNPIANLAAVANISIVGVSHLNKNQLTQTAVYRILGSIAFTAAVRAVWLICKDPEDETHRLLIPAKGNLSKNPTGLAFKLINTSVLTEEGDVDMAFCSFFPDPINITAQQLLAPKNEPVRQSKKQIDASEWLETFLSEGPVDSKLVYEAGEELDYSKRTLERVKSKMGILAIPIRSKNSDTILRWEWRLRSS